MSARVTPTSVSASRQAGFTLIELIVVIGILSLLIAAFAPSLFGVLGKGQVAATKARITSLATMCDAYQRVYGDYPSDDFSLVAKDAQAGWNFGTDNGKNSGIESLVLHLSWAKGVSDLDQHEDWLANTDNDKTPVVIPMLERRDKVEVTDAWGTPLAVLLGARRQWLPGIAGDRRTAVRGCTGRGAPREAMEEPEQQRLPRPAQVPDHLRG